MAEIVEIFQLKFKILLNMHFVKKQEHLLIMPQRIHFAKCIFDIQYGMIFQGKVIKGNVQDLLRIFLP